ncbi:hypothetical protein CSC78_18600 [Pseudoxanthomonas japonensis]|uniref:Signal recognition particle-docking protein FtsY n=1 Tax=Pseudoxanthomonas japonensis TaxID=69284 RepID=A0ABQ6ZCA0_9GAMM|nr:hypothetical protein CSC78_18600 [Pseudoxanthomonas japonensis]
MIGFFRRKKPQDGPDAAQTRPSTEELAAAFPRAPSEPLPVDAISPSTAPADVQVPKADEGESLAAERSDSTPPPPSPVSSSHLSIPRDPCD